MHLSANRRLTLARRRTDSSKLRAITGSITLSSKFPAAPAKAMEASLPMTWATTWDTASGMTGFTFPGIIELPGWRSGMCSSARPARGPLPIHRISVAHLYSDTATVRIAPEASTRASRDPWASKWSLASVSGKSELAGEPAYYPSGETWGGVEGGPYGGPAEWQLDDPGKQAASRSIPCSTAEA